MKQKKLGDILYVFDVNPYEITSDTDAEVVKVQEESFAGFIEMNPSLAEKIVKYNYHVMCINVPEWAPYVEQEDPQEQLTFGIYGSATEASIAQVQRLDVNNDILETWVAGQNLNFPFQVSFNVGEHFAVEFVNGVNPDLLNITGDALSIGWQDAETNNFWRATTALSTSTSVGIDSAEPSTYTLRLNGQGISDANLAAYVGGNPTALVDLIAGIQVAEGALVQLTLLTGDVSEYDVTNMPVWMTYVSGENPPYYIGSMPANDSTLEIDYVGAPAVTHKLYLSETATSQGISEQTLGVTIDNASATLEDLVAGIDVAEDALVEVWLLTEDASDYNVTSISQWMTQSTDGGLHYYANMPAQDKTIEINLVQTVTISGDAPLTYIKELSKNKSTTINTYTNPTLPVTLTVAYNNILALSAGSSSDAPRSIYAMTPSNFANQSWTDSATGDKCSITNPIKEDKSCELNQKRTLSLSGSDINNGNLKVTLGNVPQDLTELVNGKLVNPGTTINVWLLTENVSDYDVTSIETWMTQSTDGGLHYTATMPTADKQIGISYIGTPLTPYTLNLTGGILDYNLLQVKLGGFDQSLSDLTDYGVTAYTTLKVEVELLDTQNLAYYDTSSISQWMTQDLENPAYYTAMMPAANTTIDISYSVPE